jgi:hypothetical protein
VVSFLWSPSLINKATRGNYGQNIYKTEYNGSYYAWTERNVGHECVHKAKMQLPDGLANKIRKDSRMGEKGKKIKNALGTIVQYVGLMHDQKNLVLVISTKKLSLPTALKI